MTQRRQSAFSAAIALSLGLALAGCAGDVPNNRSVNSVNQPVVERRNFALDLTAGYDGLPVPEQLRLADWFESMDLRYGDRIAVNGAMRGSGAYASVAAIAARHGLLLSEGAPLTEGYVAPGNVRVVVTRTRAFVPDCPDWTDQQASNLDNGLSDNFGCATNGNLAAMIANPEHLLHGAAGTGETVVMSSSKAIESYRDKAPTGAAGLPAISSQGN